MASPDIIDLDTLIAPVSEDQPQGIDLRENRTLDSNYSKLKDARNSARAAERASMFDDDSAGETLSHWHPILDLSPTILAEESKDLEVASWYMEALVRFQGFAGLRDGLKLVLGLVEQYWDDLYPEPDEDGLETKVGPLTGLNGDGGEGTLITPLRNVIITTEGAHGEFSYWQYKQAMDASKINDEHKRSERHNSLGFNLDQIENTVNVGDTNFYVNLLDDIQLCLDTIDELNNKLREHCGHDTPPSSNIKNVLEEVLRSCRFLTQTKLAHLEAGEQVDEEAGEGDGATSSSAVATGGAGGGPLNNREQALGQLQEVAKYFRRTEPHSPISAAIERAVRWGRMEASELFKELIPNEEARNVYTQLTGVLLEDKDEDDGY